VGEELRHLIICCDGTWQAATSDSNVARLHRALAARTRTGVEQKCRYIQGVGTSVASWLPGGLAGAGLSSNIMAAYEWLVQVYRPGDVVALFGFSRGAYTARSLAGMIGRCGLLEATGPTEVKTRVARVYRRYRERVNAPEDVTWRTGLSFVYEPDGPDPIPVHLIGVWDTVGALGIPDHLDLFDGLDRDYHEFHDVALDPQIRHARHAVALDELRGTFAPTLWSDPAPGQDVEQVWFPGGHLDVGGGWYPKGLSDGALLWMMDEAESTVGIEFDSRVRERFRADALAVSPHLLRYAETLTSPLTEFGFQPWPRATPPVRADEPDPNVHESAHARQAATSLPGGPYRPTRTLAPGGSATVDVPATDGWAATGLWLEPGTYTFTAAGIWSSAGTPVGPAGGTRPRTPVNLIGSAIGRVEGLIRSVVKNDSPSVIGGRREHDLPWMSLVGYVANERRDKSGRIRPGCGHERIPIGAGTTQRINRPGYLYAFANEAWGYYWNNRGSVELTVTAAG
jgi:hypothetical protein